MSRARLAGLWRSAVGLDHRLSQRLRVAEGRTALRMGALAAAHLGDSPLWAAASAVAYWLGSAHVRSAVMLMAAAVLVTATIGAGIKAVVRRPRPGGYATWLYSRRMDQHSFPSGHAARVGAVAVTISAAYPHLIPVTVVYALGVAVARVALGVHYLGDVLFGLLLGGVVGAIAILVIGL